MAALTRVGGGMNIHEIKAGDSLVPLAHYHDVNGWQLVPCQWHVDQKTGQANITPLSGLTGKRAPFLTGAAIRSRVRHLVLHPEGGPECVGRKATVAVRSPWTVVGLDFDHGYSAKSGKLKAGGDTLVKAEMHLGPLPPMFSLTARGPYQPSRRVWLRKPADLVLYDSFFYEFGGDIEIVRTDHRFSWTWPGVHHKNHKPILWYDPNWNVCGLPHIDDLYELPPRWVERGYELMAARAAKESEQAVEAGAGRIIGERHADNLIAKMVRKFMDPDFGGGDFRSHLFWLTANITSRAIARGDGEAEIWDELRELWEAHPTRQAPNDRDVQWIEEGIRKGRSIPWIIEPEVFNPDGTPTEAAVSAVMATYGPEGYDDPRMVEWLIGEQPPTLASPDELDAWIKSFTRYRSPARLHRRIEWMARGDLTKHAAALVEDTLNGDYPASLALNELANACRARGDRDPSTPQRLLSAALGAALGAALDAKAVTG